jgi:hypothetical protein
MVWLSDLPLATMDAWHICRRNILALYERLRILVVTTKWRTVEFIAELFETSIDLFLDGLSMLARNNLILVNFSHGGEEAICR